MDLQYSTDISRAPIYFHFFLHHDHSGGLQAKTTSSFQRFLRAELIKRLNYPIGGHQSVQKHRGTIEGEKIR